MNIDSIEVNSKSGTITQVNIKCNKILILDFLFNFVLISLYYT